MSGRPEFVLRTAPDAPFGRNIPSSFSLPVNGDVAWLLMEAVSPAALLYAISASSSDLYAPIARNSLPTPLAAVSQLQDAFVYLPRARTVLVLLYLTHYLNRSVVSTFRNPGRAKMGVAVPLAAILFNLLNGSLQGIFLAGGYTGETGINVSELWYKGWGLQPGREVIFVGGVVLFFCGFVGNVVSDEHLYALKRGRSPAQAASSAAHDRYTIPRGWLYDKPFGGISYPAYTCEWVEWTGFLLATLALEKAPFPSRALQAATTSSWTSLFSSSPLRKIPKQLWPFANWWLQPPALFL